MRGQAVLQTGTNAKYPVHPHAHLCNPRASIYSLEDMALCSNMQRAKVILLPQVPCPYAALPVCFSSMVYQVICAWFWLSTSEWAEQRQKWPYLLCQRNPWPCTSTSAACSLDSSPANTTKEWKVLQHTTILYGDFPQNLRGSGCLLDG